MSMYIYNSFAAQVLVSKHPKNYQIFIAYVSNSLVFFVTTALLFCLHPATMVAVLVS